MRRREFITLLGGAAAWSVAARAQQPAMPVIGYLSTGSPDSIRSSSFREGLSESGYIDGRNVAIEYRWAGNEYDRLPELAADLVRRRVAVIVASPLSAALAAKAATSTIPVVFFADNAVEGGLVTNLGRPDGNLTGINGIVVALGAKRLGLLQELQPQTVRFGVLVNPNVPRSTLESTIAEAQAAAAAVARPLEVLYAGNNREIEMAFADVVRRRVDALAVSATNLFYDRRVQLTTFAARYAVPTIFPDRSYAEAGGLMSYGPNYVGLFRQAGEYVGRILKGEKPADLPVIEPTKFELVVNLQTARLLGLAVPPTLRALADEVIE